MNMRRILIAIVMVAALGTVVGLAQGRGGGNAQQPGNVPTAADPNALKVYIRAGLKSHGPGLHDYQHFAPVGEELRIVMLAD